MKMILKMSKKGLLLLFVLFSFQIYSQSRTATNNTQNNRAIFCLNENGDMIKLENVIVNPTSMLINKIQKQFSFIGFDVVKTGVLDYQTKEVLKSFNKNIGLKELPYIFNETVSVLNSHYKQKKKSIKTNI